MSGLTKAKRQAARYAQQTGLDSVTMALFTPVQDEKVLEALSTDELIEDVQVMVCAIGWG